MWVVCVYEHCPVMQRFELNAAREISGANWFESKQMRLHILAFSIELNVFSEW